MDRRRTFSFLLPLVGLVITGSEVLRLLDACLAQERLRARPVRIPVLPDRRGIRSDLRGEAGLLAYEYLRSQR